jgi:lipoate-protein ligase A
VPVTDVAIAHALLLRVARGELPGALRVYRPAPTVAFGKLDALRPGFAAAVEAARSHGFTPVLRAPGGHAAAYDPGTVVFDLVAPSERLFDGLHDTFRSTSAALAASLSSLGVHALVGSVPGEYCCGDYSVNARGAVKLVGTAQRAVRGAALLGGFVTASGSARLRPVLVDVYAALGLAWDPATLGAVDDEVAVGVDAVQRAVVSALGTPGEPDEATLALAASLEPQHVV